MFGESVCAPSGRVWWSDFHGRFACNEIRGLRKRVRVKVRTHHSGYLRGKRWNKGRRRKSTGKVIQKQVVGSGGRGHASVGGGPHCLPKDGTDLRCCIEHALCSGDHR